ncbi:hypothetical protein JW930_05920 [Candidatus Woesearchaeota archaeon]|nr:hypothetical protein [Candidatus Woesearchaeota archaeon]
MADDYEDDEYDDSISESREEALEDDEVSPQEAAFMEGYDQESGEAEDEEEDIDKEFE